MDLIFYKKNDKFSFKLEKHEVFPARGEKGKSFCCKDLRKYILCTFNQKTPKQYERSGATLISLWAHPVCKLFSGIGVPLIRIFQDVALFL